ncbi:hypothetical protein [Nocardioides sp. Root190]|uniref:hypothetical protein n=1 Tax=Nocardioides sp. Root190 TaxID=1736488 RepID=UPI0012FCB432|nr:hypothetical protein [Nocardioides sp. Root190]
MPWIEANVVAGPVWDEHADLLISEFEANERAIETDDWNEADRLYGKVRSVTVLLNPDGIVVPEYLLHTDGTTARWRWHDEPFD